MSYGNDSGMGVWGSIIVVLIVGAISMYQCSADQGTADAEARTFARTVLEIPNAKVICQNVDSGGDGYVSCTVRDPVTKEIWPLQCSGALTWNEGCALDTGKNRNANRSDRRGSW